MPKKPRSYSRKYRFRIGYEGEYYLFKKFTSLKKPGFYAVRTAGSGAGKVAKPDLLAVDLGELMAIEVKTTNKSKVAVDGEQLQRLMEFCDFFVVKCPNCYHEIKPKPILAIRFLNKGWKFIEVSKKGELNYVSL